MTGRGPGGLGSLPLAVQAAAILAVDPLGLQGAQIRVRPGPHLNEWLRRFRAMLPPGTPFRRLPARMDPGRLVGEVDVVETLRSGARQVRPGLLSEHDGGLLVVPMSERMEPEQATVLAQVLDTGEVAPRTHGVKPAPSRIALLLLDESRGDEAGPPELLAERMGLILTLEPVPREAPEPAWPSAEDVAAARDLLPAVEVGQGTLRELVALSGQLGILTLRAPRAALRAARASAALHGRTVVADDDLAAAAALVLLPRAVSLPPAPTDPDDVDAPQPPPPSPDEGEDESAVPGDRPMADRVLEAAQARLPEDFQVDAPVVGAPRSGRKGALIRQLRDGRRVGARPGDPRREGRIDLTATLQTAAPWQRRRREARPDSPARVLVNPGDLHVQIRARRSATATVFVVDASGSQALNRLAEVKGAVELLLADSYVRREEVALVTFRGRSAEIILPPTRSLVRARRALAGLPGGGGTPLALGLMEGLGLARRLQAAEATPRLVLLTDGRPNVDREGEGGRARARDDALAAARLIRESGTPFLVLDTSMRGERFSGELAGAGGGRHIHLPRADARRVRAAIGALEG